MRDTWFEAAAAARQVLAAPETAARWDAPSALASFTVRGLAGHLARAVLVVEDLLDAPPAAGQPISGGAYFAKVLTTPDLSDPLHVDIRARGEAEGAQGHARLVSAVDAAVARLEGRLRREPADRLVAARGLAMRLDDYLATRVVELAVHADDLAVSVGVPTPVWSTSVSDAVIGTALELARVRHGDLAVIRALTRRERGSADALPVF